MSDFYDHEAEKIVLGFVANNGVEALPPTFSLKEQLFSEPHQLVLDAMHALHIEGKNPNHYEAARRLLSEGTLDKAGGHIALAEIGMTNFSGYAVDSAIASLMEKAQRRAAATAIKSLNDSMADGATAEDLASQAEKFAEQFRVIGKRNGLPPIEAVSDIVKQPPKEPQQLIFGLLRQGEKLVLGGSSKAGKTWSLLDMGISISQGVDWWGFCTTKGRVLYVNFELPPWAVNERVLEICKAKGCGFEGFDVWNLRGYAADILVLEPQITRAAQKRGYSLVIFDPFYKLLGGRDENSASDLTEMLNSLERIAKATCAAVVFASHYSKGNQSQKTAIDRISGSGAIGRDGDALVTITEHGEPECFSVETTLRSQKPVPSFVVRWQWPLMHLEDLDPRDLRQAFGRKKENSIADILNVLPEEEGASTGEWQKLAYDEGISRASFMRLRKEAEVAKQIYKSPLTNKWVRR